MLLSRVGETSQDILTRLLQKWGFPVRARSHSAPPSLVTKRPQSCKGLDVLTKGVSGWDSPALTGMSARGG